MATRRTSQPGVGLFSPELAPLVKVLGAEQTIYQELLELADLERNAIVGAQLPELKSAVERKQKALAKLAELEDRRISWARGYAANRGQSLETVTLSSIIGGCTDEDQAILKRLHQGLTRRIRHLMEIDRSTRKLLESITKAIDASLHYLLSDDLSGQIYAPQGKLQPAMASRSLLDCRA